MLRSASLLSAGDWWREEQVSAVTGRSSLQRKMTDTDRKSVRQEEDSDRGVSETGGEAEEEITYVKEKLRLNGGCSLRQH